MYDSKYINDLRLRYQAAGKARRELSDLSTQAQHLSKQAIFMAQRGELSQATNLVSQAEKFLRAGQALCNKVEDISTAGVYRAALEEFVEAKLFVDFLRVGKIGKITKFTLSPETYFGGLSDFVGELVRYATRLVTLSKGNEVVNVVKIATAVVGELAALNATGPLRSKYDQAQQHLRKLEDIQYDLSLRRL